MLQVAHMTAAMLPKHRYVIIIIILSCYVY